MLIKETILCICFSWGLMKEFIRACVSPTVYLWGWRGIFCAVADMICLGVLHRVLLKRVLRGCHGGSFYQGLPRVMFAELSIEFNF